ncbi:ABC transporter ATP-binding protein [Oricola thermophila]|uniref:ABC transporter ATP-binding protein n=1 Tax=Oricola thermophila TaxID=2742145 RepID=A0A6N1VDI7_9HYPH|nr:ABC transporter ATP-binding protein [Oricola thermophila]QKV17097.1 ABC transporter ATP-binding protein [Oricola thermophila]
MFSWFEKRIDPFPAEPPEQPPATLLAFCWHYTKGIWPWLAVTSVLIALISGLQVTLFGFLGNVVDWLANADRATFLRDEGWTLAGMGAVILVLLPGLSLLHTMVMHQTIFGNYPMIIRWKAHRYLLGQSFAFYQDEFAGRVATKMMQAALGVRESVVKILDVFIYVSVYFAGTLILVGSLDLWMMLPFVVWLVFYVGLLRYFLPKMRKISEVQSNARSTMTGRVVDSYTNIMTVKLFAHSGREEIYAREAMDDFLQTVHPQMRYVTMLNTGLDMSNSLLLFAVGAVGIASWLAGAASVGALAVGVGLVLRLEGMSHWVMWELAGLFENIGMAEDGMGTIAQPRAVQDKPDAKVLTVSEGRIEFDHIRFHYGKDDGVIEDLSLAVAPGEKVGLVGRSGAGKSTLMNLLLRLYDLEGGQILIDGQNIADVTQDSLRSQIGVVTQDTSLLHRSVRDNIAYGKPDATEEEIIAAAKRANAHDYIVDLVDMQGRTGYDAHVGERGVKLSGGQRQRIAIARVFLKNAPILVLDEATSALDSEVESAIQENLYALMEGKTVIAIAHRLSTISSLDRLVVLDKGRIVEEGTHEELAQSDGLYAQLWARQSGGFIDTGETVAAE